MVKAVGQLSLVVKAVGQLSIIFNAGHLRPGGNLDAIAEASEEG